MQRPPAPVRFQSNVTHMLATFQSILERAIQAGYRGIDLFTFQLVSQIIKETDPIQLIEEFIKGSHPDKSAVCWDKIKQRDEDYFYNNALNIFCQQSPTVVDGIKELYRFKDPTGKEILTATDKNELFHYFDSFIRISIRFILQQRQPKFIEEKGTIVFENPDYMKQVNVMAEAKKWEISDGLV